MMQTLVCSCSLVAMASVVNKLANLRRAIVAGTVQGFGL